MIMRENMYDFKLLIIMQYKYKLDDIKHNYVTYNALCYSDI